MKWVGNSSEAGSLLLEVLIAIALFLAISTIIAQAIFASFYGSRESQSKLAMNDLISRQISDIRALSDEHWSNIGSLTRDTDYYTFKDSSGLHIATGTYSGVMDNSSYTLSFQVKDIGRDLVSSTTLIDFTGATSSKKDSATILIISTGVIGKAKPVIIESVLTRWRNIICVQNNWTSTTSDAAIDCESDTIGVPVKSGIEVGPQIKLCSGCI